MVDFYSPSSAATSPLGPNFSSTDVGVTQSGPSTQTLGHGPLQGTTIAVGSGEESQAIKADVEQSRGWFSTIYQGVGAAWSGTQNLFFGTSELSEELSAQDLHEESVQSSALPTTKISNPEASDAQTSKAAASTTSHGSVVVTEDNNIDDDLEVEDDDDGYLSFDDEEDDDEIFYDTSSTGWDELDDLPETNIGSGRRTQDLLSTGLDQGKVNFEEIDIEEPELTEIDFDDDEIDSALQPKEQAPAQGGWLSTFWNVAGAVTNVVTFGYLAGGPQPSSEDTATQSTAPAPTKSEQNLQRASDCASKIQTEMAKLNLQIQRMGSDAPIANQAGQLDQPTLSNWDHLSRWGYQFRGALSAGVSTTGTLAVAAAVPTVAGLASAPVGLMGGPVAGIGVNAVGVLGGAYLGLSALRDFPELMQNKAVISMINDKVKELAPEIQTLNNLIDEEAQRLQADQKQQIITIARYQKVDAAQTELQQISDELSARRQAPVTDGASPSAISQTENPTLLLQPVRAGSGQERTQILNAAKQEQPRFTSFFKPVWEGLKSIGRFIVNIPNIPQQIRADRAAQAAENRFVSSYRDMLGALRQPSESTILRSGIEVRAVQASNGAVELSQARQMISMGENIAQGLVDSEEANFGGIEFSADNGQRYGVPSNITSARSLGWYFEALADRQAQSADNTDPIQVKRETDGSLTISDPDRKLHGFLMNAPTAVNTLLNESGEREGVLRIDDHSRQLPGGNRTMLFNTDIVDNKEVLRVRYDAQRHAPVTNLPAAYKGKLQAMYMALHTPTVASSKPSFEGQSTEALEQRQAELMTQIKKDLELMKGDQAQTKELPNWQNPAFLATRA